MARATGSPRRPRSGSPRRTAFPPSASRSPGRPRRSCRRRPMPPRPDAHRDPRRGGGARGASRGPPGRGRLPGLSRRRLGAAGAEPRACRSFRPISRGMIEPAWDGLGTARVLARLGVEAGTLLAGMVEDGTLPLGVRMALRFDGVSPRLPLEARFDPAALLAALAPHLPAEGLTVGAPRRRDRPGRAGAAARPACLRVPRRAPRRHARGPGRRPLRHAPAASPGRRAGARPPRARRRPSRQLRLGPLGAGPRRAMAGVPPRSVRRGPRVRPGQRRRAVW